MNSSNPTSLNLTCQKNELAESKLTGWTNSLNFHPPNLHEFVRFDKFVCSMRCDSTSWDWRVRIRRLRIWQLLIISQKTFQSHLCLNLEVLIILEYEKQNEIKIKSLFLTIILTYLNLIVYQFFGLDKILSQIKIFYCCQIYKNFDFFDSMC